MAGSHATSAVARLHSVSGDDGIGLGFCLTDDHVEVVLARAARLRGAVAKRDAAAAGVLAEPVFLPGLRRVGLRPVGGLAAGRDRRNYGVRCRCAAYEDPVVVNVGAQRLDVLLDDLVLLRQAVASDRARVANTELHSVVALADILFRVCRDGSDGGRRGARSVERPGLRAVDQGRATES